MPFRLLFPAVSFLATATGRTVKPNEERVIGGGVKGNWLLISVYMFTRLALPEGGNFEGCYCKASAQNADVISQFLPCTLI